VRRTRGLMTSKSISIKGAGCKSGGCAVRAVGLTSGDLPRVPEAGLRKPRGYLSTRQESAEGVVLAAKAAGKARTEGSGE
jgi:hypothetical protein